MVRLMSKQVKFNVTFAVIVNMGQFIGIFYYSPRSRSLTDGFFVSHIVKNVNLLITFPLRVLELNIFYPYEHDHLCKLPLSGHLLFINTFSKLLKSPIGYEFFCFTINDIVSFKKQREECLFVELSLPVL